MGVVLYEMLSGSVPFKASTPSAVLIKHLQEQPAPLRKIRREVPPVIERLVMQALEKKPQKRLKDMHAVVEGLQKANGISDRRGIGKSDSFTDGDSQSAGLS